MAENHTHSQSRLAYFPVSFFSSVMGMAGFSIALAKAESIYHLDSRVSLTLSMFTVVLFLSLLGLYAVKLFTQKRAVIQELHHPIKISFFPTVSISLILLSITMLHINRALADILWLIGTSLHLIFTLYVMNAWINHDHFDIKHMNPAWFIPIVGNILVPISGVPLGYTDVSWFFFSIGLMFWPVLLTIIYYRVIFHPALPGKLIPTFFILIAPPAVGFLSYLQLNGELDNFARILYFAALFFTLLVFTQFRKFSKLQFFLSWWAYSFPMAAISIATMVMYQKTDNIIFSVIGISLLTILTLFISMLIIKTSKAIMDQQICVEE
ncbi:MAG: SLAC1 anion channel family protein [gamma proteobacterium symbiont of Bathyaustriella thionipta]|nr:SLAC1 anion channel family protein [gamma proteobacterium symbiont of Bathyaustriella thionipta]MCU7950674.1 SLAC1 anion channel family protein [gamma proteobacterium symbiont of Bathyaustriella thionipta]MCU7954331.1 SLAC1 anion channel family protein [gamma proteobacterium symbiont of Bathyaustriella thionipta]MCU7957282.1 SLAC1 anion channel family protein [gamma proteobacterium symbiont of Bathyaustriella thionipta]MCU7968221.1 SLAC1 anion channel family protein [gamma proteobacterium sy